MSPAFFVCGMTQTTFRIINQRRGTVLAERATLAASFVARTVGLLGVSSLARGRGIILRPCASVHTYGMRFAIDVVFADSTDTVIGLHADVAPWRDGVGAHGAAYAIELPAGTIVATGTEVGDTLQMAPANS